jgi:hypothetical protein
MLLFVAFIKDSFAHECEVFRRGKRQCCGSGSAWIQIEKGRIRIRIHIEVICWIRIRINLQMTSQYVWNMSLFEHFFNKVLSLYLEARIQIKVTSIH